MESSTRARKVITLLVTSLGSFMVLLDGSIVLVALPTIQADIQAQLSDLQWTVDAYTLPFAALMLTAGTLGDRIGRKRVFLAGLALFLVGSAVCGLAPELSWLIIGRVIQGIGAAAIGTGSLALLVSTFTGPRERAHAIGIWTAVSGVSLATGPLVGGLLIEAFDWPAIFFMNLPIGVVALLLGVPRLLESRNPNASRIDLPGQVLVTAGLTSLIFALIQGERQGWSSPLIVSLLIGAAVLLTAFVIVERRVREPMLPLDLFRNPSFSVVCVTAVLLGFIIVGAMFFMAQYFQAIQGSSALGAGLRLLPLTLGIFFVSPLAARLAGKAGPRPPVAVGALLAAAGFWLLSMIAPTESFASVWWRLALVGVGIGFMFAPLTVAVMAATPPQRAGLGSSMINTSRIVGFTAGAAILGTYVLARFTDNIAAQLTSRGAAPEASDAVADDIAHTGAFAAQSDVAGRLQLTPAQATEAINAAFVDAFQSAFIVCAICMVVASALVLLLMGRGRPSAPAGRGGPAAGAAGGPGRPSGSGEPAKVGAAARVSQPTSPLVETDWLVAQLGKPGLRVVDCTVVLRPLPTGGVDMQSGLPSFERGHIPGAVFADLLQDLADPEARKPFALPSPERFAAAVEKLGISGDDVVVVYDQAHTAFATRLRWMLRYFGFDNAYVLNGGWKKWTLEGRPVSSEPSPVHSGHFVPRPRPEMLATKDDVVAATSDTGTCLINALAPAQHDGQIPVAHGRRGHIASSVNVPAVALVDGVTGAYLPTDQLKKMLGRVGATDADKVITYCAAGVNATSDAFVLEMLGVTDVTVYDGGLVEWGADPSSELVVKAQ